MNCTIFLWHINFVFCISFTTWITEDRSTFFKIVLAHFKSELGNTSLSLFVCLFGFFFFFKYLLANWRVLPTITWFLKKMKDAKTSHKKNTLQELSCRPHEKIKWKLWKLSKKSLTYIVLWLSPFSIQLAVIKYIILKRASKLNNLIFLLVLTWRIVIHWY